MNDFWIGRWSGSIGRVMAVVVLAVGVALLGPVEGSSRQMDARRIALVMTNNSAGPDIAAGGEAVRQTLAGLGYSVTAVGNAGQRDFDRAIGQVEGQADQSSIVAIYYAGFGVRANGRDYLVPAGVTLANAADLAAQAVDLDDTIQRLRAKGAVVTVFLDACPSSLMLNALGGVCAGDPARRTPDVYLISSADRMRPGDLTAQLPGLLKGGRTVAQTFSDLETTFQSIAVVQIPTPPSPRAASVTFGVAAQAAPAPVAPAPAPPRPAAPPPSPVQPLAAPQPQPTPPADAVDLVTFLTSLLDLTDAAEVQKARALATEFNARYGSELDRVDPRGRYTVEATLAYVNGDYQKALRAIEAIRAAEAAQNLPALSGNQERRRNRLEGSIYLRLGLPQLAIPRLEAEEKSYIGFTDNASKSGPVWSRLGEAYRLAGRRSEAREMLKNAERVQSRGGKGLAYVQLSLLSYDEGAYQDAADTANTAIDILNGPPAMSGLADAYIAFAKARFKLRPRDEGEAWRYVDLARETDPGSAAAKAFGAELPARLVDPPFASMRPTFSFSRDIERRALTCYDTPEARDAYLATITAESAAASAYLVRIDAYMKALNRRLADYEAHGYLEDYEGSVRGRGYRFRTQILAEQAAWIERWTEIEGRIASLATWFGISARADVPCKDGPGSQLRAPGYQPMMPREGFTGAAVASAPAPQAAATPPASSPPAMVNRPSPPAPLITSPTVAAAPAQPPAPRPVTLVAAVPPPPTSSSPQVTQPSPRPLTEASPPSPAASSPAPKPVILAVAEPPPAATPSPPRPLPASSSPEVMPTSPRPLTETSLPLSVASSPAPKPVQTAAAPPTPAPPSTAPPAGGLPRPDSSSGKAEVASIATTAAPTPPPRAMPSQEAPQPLPSKSAAPRLAASPPATAAAPPPAGPAVQVVAQPPAPAPAAPAPASSGSLVAPPPILLALAPPTPPTPPTPPAVPQAKGKPPGKAAPPPATGPAAAKAAADRASVLVAQGKYDQAQREYASAVAADPANAEARAGEIAARGLSRLQAGQAQAAVDDLNSSLAIHPLPAAYEGLGRIYAANATRGPAIDMFTKAIALRPTYAQAYFGRAEARRERASPLRDTAELEAAGEDYRAVLMAKSDLPEALFGLGVTRFMMNDYAGAVESFDGALRARPIYPDAKYARARSQFELTRYQEALKDLVDLPPAFDAYARACSTGLAFFALADAALAAKDEPRAIELFGQAAQALAPALAARPDDGRAKFWALLSSQNAMPGLPGRGSRAKERLIMQFAPNKPRPAPAPTATLAYADACRRV